VIYESGIPLYVVTFLLSGKNHNVLAFLPRHLFHNQVFNSFFRPAPGLRPCSGLIAVGGGLATPAAVPEPCVRLSPHTALRTMSPCHGHCLPWTRSWQWAWRSARLAALLSRRFPFTWWTSMTALLVNRHGE